MTQRFHNLSHMAAMLFACGAMLSPTTSSASYSWNFTTCGSLNNSNPGNSLGCTGSASGESDPQTVNITLTGWSNTDNGSGYLETGKLVLYGTNGYGLTNRENNTDDDNEPSGNNGEHAFDSEDRIDAALLDFGSKQVQLTQIVNGWTDASDSDITVFYYKGDDGAANSPASAWGTDLNPTPDNPSYAQLVAKGWAVVGHFANGDTYNIATQTSGIKSSYWLVSAFNSGITSPCYKADGTATSNNCGTSTDYFKLKSVAGNYTKPPSDAPSVPEPGSLALLGLGSLILVRARRAKS